jgi:tRNA-specific adenosine deaminase 3
MLRLFPAESLPPYAYLCSGLDLYLTYEPDLMAAMALVHSRIRRVFFQHADPKMGALLSGRGHIHCLRSLNHHYRVFQLKPAAVSVDSASAADSSS